MLPSPTVVSTTIVYAENDSPSRTVVAEVLRGHGFRVLEAPTAQQALLLADEAVDLVLLDVNLPDTAGVDLCR
jgi:DNA-binding response OmpR family regulator